MNNPLSPIGHGLEVVGKDTLHVIEAIPTFLGKVEHVLAAAIRNEPAVQTAVLALIAQATTVVGDVSSDVENKGINVAQDLKTLADANAFFAYFTQTFVPAIEQVYKDAK